MAGEVNKLPAGFAVGDTIASRYVLKKVLNSDTGEAELFVCEYDDFPFLAKIYFPEKTPSEEKIEQEKKINSHYLIKKSDRFTFNGCSCEIMPFFNKADLISSGKPVNDKRLFETIIPNVIEALKTIHEAGVVHGNVRPTNIYYSPFGPDQVMLGDYGVDISNAMEPTKQTAFGFFPPENAKGIFGKEADFWSLGVTLIALVTGRDPFEGLNRKQILKKACTFEPEIPAKASDMLKNIIRGLTIKDHTTRWGYDEVKQCLAGEEVAIVDNYVYEPPTSVYNFNGTAVDGLENIAKAFALDWDNAVSCVNDPALLEIVDNYAEDKYNDVLNCCKLNDKNLALFKLISILNPSLPPYWKGQQLGDLNQFASEMVVAYDKEPYMDALRSNIVSSVAEKQGIEEDILTKIKKLENEVNVGAGEELTSYKLRYYVSGEYIYEIGGVECKAVSDLVNYVKNNADRLDDVCNEFINDIQFFAWLEVLGYGEQIRNWRKTVY